VLDTSSHEGIERVPFQLDRMRLVGHLDSLVSSD
jgi:hypothetical protein